MSGIEGLGEAVTGGMVARAVEPAAGAAPGAHGGICLNCGTALQGEYCHHCGQAGHVHRTLHAFFHDLIHGVFHFEGKIWHTLPMLAFRPGELTRRYIAGERARFVSPMALFLFSVFLMFAVFHLVGGPFATIPNTGTAASQKSVADIDEELAEARGDATEAASELAEAKSAGEPTRSQEITLAAARTKVAALENARKVAGRPPARGKERTRKAETLEEGAQLIDADTGFAPLDGALSHIKENPKLAIYKLQSNAYKFSWALIPLSVPLVWCLFFWKRRFGLYDHTVFVTYSIAAMSLGVILLSLLRPIGLSEDAIDAATVFLPPIHIYKQVKGAYGLSRFSALWRTIMLIIFAFIAASWFFTIMLGIGALD